MPAKTSPSASKSDFALLEKLWREPVERQILPNGVTLIIKPDHSAALASVQVWVKTGSVHENTYLGAGLSHFLEHMLFKGTPNRAGREISATVQAHGGYINAYTTFDRTVYYIDLPSEHTPVAIEILADAVLRSSLPAEEVDKEKEVILREIDMGLDDPDQRLGQHLFDTVYREHPYRHPIIGHREVFEQNTRENLVAYYTERYVPNNLVVVVVGAVDPASIRREVEKHFGSSPRRRLPPVYLPAEPVQLARRERHDFESVEISRVNIGWQIPGLDHPDAPALDVLAMILGYGDSSILWQALREKARLVHSIDASSWNPGTTGLFYVAFTADPDKRAAAIKALEREIARCGVRGFTTAQISKSVRQIVVSEINTRKTMSGQASRLGVAEVVVGDLDHAKSYFEHLRKITPAMLKQVLKKYLVPEHLTIVSLNPTIPSLTSAETRVVADAGFKNFAEETLSNGARLLLQSDPKLPNLHLRVICLGGPFHEPADLRGATDLMATLLTKDTAKRSAEEVARAIETVGGSFHEFTGNNSFGLALEVLPGDVDLALELLGDALLTPAFKKESFETERAAALAALQQDRDDVVTYGRKLIRQKFFGGHPLAIDSHGDEAGLKKASPADLRALHKKLIVAGNVVFAVAGDFVPEKLSPKLRAFLKKLPKGQPPVSSAKFAHPAEIGDFIEPRPSQQAVVYQ